MRVAYPLLRLARKRVITVFLGSDVRPPYLNAKFVGLVGPIDARSLIQETDLARARLLSAERWSHHVVNHPPTALFATRKFVDFMTLGLPYRASPRGAGPHEVVPGDRVRVLHAPSAPIVKGTAVIRSAIDELRSEGIPIDYQEISGRPHAEVLEELQLAQLVVAEAYSDQPMPGIATEAAAYGVAVIIGSEDWRGANHGLPQAAIPPTVQVHPTDIAQAIRELVLDPDRRARLGREGEAFVRTRWSPAAVAGRFLRVIQDDIPEDWFRGPADVGYVHGVGLPQTRLAEAVATLVGSFGPGALGLDANPALRDRLLDLARTASGTETPAA
jgi:glycosyltransferase involved in cell wall biosynthesis